MPFTSSLCQGLVNEIIPICLGGRRACSRLKSHPAKVQRQCIVFQPHQVITACAPRRSSSTLAVAIHRTCRCQANSGNSAETTSSGGKILTLPTILTLARVVAIPALVVSWFSQEWTACAALFIGASLTDYLDGYLARKLNASSAFGAFLDPVADKLMVATVLILNGLNPVPAGPLIGNTWLFPVLACIIIGREITMSALREWAAALGPEAHSAVAVSWTGKWKTAAQMVSLTLLLVVKVPGLESKTVEVVGATGVALLGFAALLTVWSLIEYFKALWKFMVR